MLDKTRKPDSKEIISFIGDQVATKWLQMEDFLNTHYDFKLETVFYGNKYVSVIIVACGSPGGSEPDSAIISISGSAVPISVIISSDSIAPWSYRSWSIKSPTEDDNAILPEGLKRPMQ